MKADPILAELWAVRDRLAARFELRRRRHFPTHQGGRSQVGFTLRRMPASPTTRRAASWGRSRWGASWPCTPSSAVVPGPPSFGGGACRSGHARTDAHPRDGTGQRDGGGGHHAPSRGDGIRPLVAAVPPGDWCGCLGRDVRRVQVPDPSDPSGNGQDAGRCFRRAAHRSSILTNQAHKTSAPELSTGCTTELSRWALRSRQLPWRTVASPKASFTVADRSPCIGPGRGCRA